MDVGSGHAHGDCRRVEARLHLLLEATRRFAETVDYPQTVERIADFTAERFASFALLDIVADDGRIERVAVAHRDPARAHLVEALRRFPPPGAANAEHAISRAMASAEVVIETVDERWLARIATGPAHAAALRRIEVEAVAIVPVIARDGRVLGALTCALDAGADRVGYDADDIVLARELGRCAGLAIENARLFEHEHRIAVALQSASLPAALPKIAGLRLDANYRPGRSEATIGGDWYDAFELHDGRVIFTIGDVVGSGLAAAVTMTKLRQAMQSAAMLQAEPAAMLDVAERTLRLHDPSAYATAIAGVYDSRTAIIRMASAGHPAPLLVRDGIVSACDVRGLMLGVALGTVRPEVEIAAPRGTSFVFYTDGVTEIDGHFDIDERRLREIVGRKHLMRFPRPAREIVDAVLVRSRVDQSDDIALMTVSVV